MYAVKMNPIRKALNLVAALALMGCASTGAPSATQVTPEPTPGDSTTPYVAITADGTDTVRTAPAVEELDFLYQTRVGDGFGVYVSAGGRVQRVDADAPGGRHKHPAWTSDGSQVAFVAEGEWDAQTSEVVRGSAVWVVDPTGENAVALISCECWDLNNPAWSPNGELVAYAEFDPPGLAGPQPAASRIVVLDLATKQRTVVVESEPGQLVDLPNWSADGESLVVSIDRFDDTGNETGSSFGIVPAAGGQPLTPMLPFEKYAYAADWNWVTGTLVFSVETQGDASPDPRVSPWDLFEIQPDGTGRRTITDVGGRRLSLPRWSADGSLIAATLDAEVAVVVDPATGAITPLADPVSYYARLRG